MDIIVFFSDLSGYFFSFPQFKIILAVVFLNIIFIILRCIHSVPSLSFYREGMLKFVKGLYYIYLGDHVIYVFDVMNYMY